MADLQAIIFDVDGTLADTEETHRLAFNRAFAEFGLEWEWTPRLYGELLSISGGRERMQTYAEQLGESFNWPRSPSDFFHELHRVKTALYARMLVEGNVPLRPGVRRLLDEARAHGLRLAIATSSRRSNVTALLDNNLDPSWASWFEVIATCDVVPEKKPSPAVYEYVLESLALPAGRCIAIEDTENGNAAARAAGVKSLVTTHYFTRGGSFPGAALVVDHLGEPDLPMRPAAGTLVEAPMVDVALLRALIASNDDAERRPAAGRNAA